MPELYSNKSEEKKVSSDNSKRETYRERHAELASAKSPISSYCEYPSNVKFISTDDEEVVLLLLRKHWVTNLNWIFTGLILLVVPSVLVYFPQISVIPVQFLVVAILFWYLVSLAYILEKFLSWFFNVYIVTDERVFDVDFYNLVDRDISDADIEDIQDVTSAIRGAIRTWFDYGDIQIQTSAEIPEIEFEAVPHPDRVAKILRELRVEEQEEQIEGRVR